MIGHFCQQTIDNSLKLISEKGEKYLIETPGSYYKRQASQTDRKPRKTLIGKLLI